MNCPCCGAKLIKDAEEVALRCPNSENCKDQIHRRLVHFSGKDGLDIENLGDKVVEQLVDLGYIKRPSDIFKLTAKQLENLPNFKEKSIQNLLDSIHKAKDTTVEKLISALGIRYIGAQASTAIGRSIINIEDLFTISLEQLRAIPGIGEKAASALQAYFENETNRHEIKTLEATGMRFLAKRTDFDTSHYFFNKRIVITGALERMSRQEAQKLLTSKGAIIADSVTKKTDFVIVGHDPGSKLEKAKKLGLTILSESDFLRNL